MKSINTVILSAFVMLLLMPMAQASALSNKLPLICQNPLKAICQDIQPLFEKRKSYIENLEQEISAEVEKASFSLIEEIKKNVSNKDYAKKRIQIYKIEIKETLKIASRKIKKFEGIVLPQNNIELVKGYMYQAIDESNFNLETRNNFKSSVKEVIVGNFADYLERIGTTDKSLFRGLEIGCGKYGLENNAFATKIKNKKYVLLCPGLLISLAVTPDRIENFLSILHVLAHELGHHIDTTEFKTGIYNNYLKCISNHYAKYFARIKKDEDFCRIFPKKTTKCYEKIVTSHREELIADAWAAKVLAIHLQRQNYSFLEAEEFLSNNLIRLCNLGADGIHPPVNLRIGAFAINIPEVSNYLGCSDRKYEVEATCSFGRTPEI